MCTDVLKTLCSPAKVRSLLSTSSSITGSSSAVQRVASWTRAVSAAVEKLNEDFEAFPDVVQPFATALKMVL